MTTDITLTLTAGPQAGKVVTVTVAKAFQLRRSGQVATDEKADAAYLDGLTPHERDRAVGRPPRQEAPVEAGSPADEQQRLQDQIDATQRELTRLTTVAKRGTR